MRKIVSSTFASLALALLFVPQAFAQEDRDLNFFFRIPTNVTPQQLVSFVVNAAFVLAILIALVFLIYGGIRWILSGGDDDKVKTARGTIIAAIIGLVLVALSYVILNFVLVLITGNGITGLTIPSLTEPDPPNVIKPRP